MRRQRAYLLPDVLCPTEKLGICVQIPNNLGHMLAFLAQIERLANWYAWEANPTRDNEVVAACWREVFDDIRAKIDAAIGCDTMTGLKDIRMVDCVIEKQLPDDSWQTVGNVLSCVQAGIEAALADGTIPASPYPAYPEPQTNPTNPDSDAISCGIADFTSDYLIEKFHDNLDLIEAGIAAGTTIFKIAADVASAVTGIGVIAGGAVDAIKDVIEGSVAVTFAVIRASDTVEWRSDVKCALYNQLKANGGTFGEALSPGVTNWKAEVKGMTPAISPLFGRFLDAFDIATFRKLAVISENNEGECDDCTEVTDYLDWYRNPTVTRLGLFEYIVEQNPAELAPYWLRRGDYCLRVVEFEVLNGNTVDYIDHRDCDDTVHISSWLDHCMRSGYCSSSLGLVKYRVKFELCG